jgi:hypothetical protein
MFLRNVWNHSPNYMSHTRKPESSLDALIVIVLFGEVEDIDI